MQKSIRFAYGTGLLMTLLNPPTLIFWFSVVPATRIGEAGPPGIADGQTRDLPMLCAGVFIGTVGWVLFFGTAMALAARSANRRAGRQQKWLAATDAVGGLTLLGFATVGFLRLVRLLL